jgi:DNA helicase-2/ATP-dependent DNA helicase PcrA
VAGDPDQAIYGHRGSHTRYFHQFVRDFSRPKQQAIRHALWRNYRSPESILCFSHNLISKQPDPQRIQAVATITGANRISIKAHDDPHTEAIGIAQQIIEYVSADHLAHTALNQESTATTAKTDTGYTGLTTEAQHKLSQIAIIYRSRQQLPYIESALQQARLPYHLTKPGSITSHPDLQLILAFLRQAIPPHCEELSLSIILQYWPTIQHETALEFRKFQELHPLNPQALRIFAQQTPMLQSQRDEIYQICNLIEQLRNRVHPNTHIRPIIEWLNNQLTMLLPVEMLTPDSAISSLLFHADLASRPDQFLQHLLLEHAPVSPTQIPNQITILPIYASKNRQFPVVIIPGCEEGLWPWQESLHDPKALAEERKLFYVACTRCQQQLWITSANTRLLLDQEQKMKPSRYL